MYKVIIICFSFCFLFGWNRIQAQETQVDSTIKLNSDAIFERPFIFEGRFKRNTTAIGGYLEANTNYFITDGVKDKFSFEFRRFNIFLYSTIVDRIKFLAEIEFEHGVEEINLETALIDIELHTAFNLRSGIILPPIGYFNQNHDSPKWEFVDRPLVSSTILAATLSEVGFGFHGRFFHRNWAFAYETYLVNGLGDGIVANELNRTSLQDGKHEAMFAKDNNGSPAFTGRISVKKRNLGEIGLSTYTGIYNQFEEEDLTIDEKRLTAALAFDYNFSFADLQVLGELAYVKTEVTPGLRPQFGEKQLGLHVDLIYPVLRKEIFGWKDLVLNVMFRAEYVDYNLDSFEALGITIGDEITAIVPGVSARIAEQTVIRLNYRYEWNRDFLSNPAVKTAGFQVGIASYF